MAQKRYSTEESYIAQLMGLIYVKAQLMDPLTKKRDATDKSYINNRDITDTYFKWLYIHI